MDHLYCLCCKTVIPKDRVSWALKTGFYKSYSLCVCEECKGHLEEDKQPA